MDNHLYATMTNEASELDVRKACAKALLSSPDSMYRSKAYWFLYKAVVRNGYAYTVARH